MARSDRFSPSRKRLTIAAGFVVLLPLFVACNSLIGLSDFEKGECPGARCGDGGDLDQHAGGDAGLDAPPNVRGADPVSWAGWPMPNYDGGATFLPNPLKYQVLDENRVEDIVTGLVWRRAVLPADGAESDARAACAALDPSTGPWRLPKRIELVTLLDFGRASILIDPVFTGVKNVLVWSSSEVRPFSTVPAAYWTVHFGSGVVEGVANGLVAKTLCVNGK